jgi:hypothetical protein
VNYLSHFFIDQKAGAHYYNIALLLPDITKQWIKKIDPGLIPQPYSEIQSELISGSLKHYESDRLFHSSAFFEKYQGLINDKLKLAPLSENVNRKWFIAHVLTELLIDRQIVKTNKTCVDDFYESLILIDDAELIGFLGQMGMLDSRDFIAFLNHFRNARYIYYYADNNKFLYSLGRIMMRVGIQELSESDGVILMKAILDIEREYMNETTVLLNELKAVFNK